jgi:hypothetical protein
MEWLAHSLSCCRAFPGELPCVQLTVLVRGLVSSGGFLLFICFSGVIDESSKIAHADLQKRPEIIQIVHIEFVISFTRGWGKRGSNKNGVKIYSCLLLDFFRFRTDP